LAPGNDKFALLACSAKAEKDDDENEAEQKPDLHMHFINHDASVAK
jgi:hypothetical protein